MAVSVQQILQIKGEFPMTFKKEDGTQRSGRFTVASEQRVTSNANLVTLKEGDNFRSVDVTRITSLG